ncbi:hypothetical protein DAPPUDRAFT_318061 [Daphnia pulex]|uniref:Uncharacterized protein n=1 Tax=Daphnia pulex TaxID=6669 RepID=E9GHR9_DAPPU|nr:hypothetical protein DAPPUDRAFT_318061 [Daphnia pulex]|eukprot:EFX81002.1 hypothetical protein DAPPUDRAFT_318061 [Daphnia pulex]
MYVRAVVGFKQKQGHVLPFLLEKENPKVLGEIFNGITACWKRFEWYTGRGSSGGSMNSSEKTKRHPAVLRKK